MSEKRHHWDDVAGTLKMILRYLGADNAVLMLERDGSVANIFTGKAQTSFELAAVQKLFRERLEECEAHLRSGEVDLDDANSTSGSFYTRDSDTGGFKKTPWEEGGDPI